MNSIQSQRHQALLTQAASLRLRYGGSDVLRRTGKANTSKNSMRKVVVTVVSTGEDPAAHSSASAFKSTVDLYDIPGLFLQGMGLGKVPLAACDGHVTC